MILTGGVDISELERIYVTDAILNGWNENHDSYLKPFETAFAEYVGVKYAKTTSGGTQALTLALAALNVGPGDEVILPDITYFACSDVIKLLGATPVFVDILPDTWCLNPDEVKRKIRSKTKAIMPVWLYGNAPEMYDIMSLGIPVVEDACPAVGSFYNQQHSGSFGTFGCFSFHGSKIMTTGFGGMIVTNDEKLYQKVLWLNNHCEDRKAPFRFWQTGIGYSFDMTNVSAALGLAQLERIEEFVTKKRLINKWYSDRLSIKLRMMTETPLSRTNMWMNSVMVDSMYTRTKVMDTLKTKGIDTRPVFFPISNFSMYTKVSSTATDDIGYTGINLPSGVQRTEEEIDFICKELLAAL